MRNFFKNIFLGLIPIFVYVLFIICIDPYNYFSNNFNTNSKSNITLTNNKALHQILKLKKSGVDQLLIGDSRIGLLNEKYINDTYNSSFQKVDLPAAKLNEIFDLAYFMIDNKDIEEIVIGMNFNMFNEFAFSSRVNEILNIYQKPLHYIFNFNIFKLSLIILRDYFFQINQINSKPSIGKNEFWQQHLETKSQWQYSRYKYPKKYVETITEFDNYCFINDIKLTIILFPHHYDDIKVLKKYNLINDKKNFYVFMSDLNAHVVNYDYYNQYILDKNNFNDPVHYNEKLGKIIVDEIFSNLFEWGKDNRDKDFINLKY